jgi:hypothetical protein
LTLLALLLAVPRLSGHEVVLDRNQKLLSWMQPQASAYAMAALTSWNVIAGWNKIEANGFPTYYTYPGYEADFTGKFWVDNEAGRRAMFVDSGAAIFGYTGDASVIQILEPFLDHQLQHGTTPADWNWASVPYSSGDPGDPNPHGADDLWACGGTHCGAGDGRGVLEPDKAGELGAAYVKFYEWTGKRRFLDAARACADALARHVRTGDTLRSPWPMRVDARTGAIKEEYTANALGPIMLFDALAAVGHHDPGWDSARTIAWNWLLAIPMKNGYWEAYFEDVPYFAQPDFNFNQYVPLETARYLLLHPEIDPDALLHAKLLLDYAERKFGADTATEKGIQYGAIAISEQVIDDAKMGSHTARFASIQALWSRRTNDPAAREKAFRSFNWATYLNDGKGHVTADVTPEGGSVSAQGFWWSDGHGDYVRHFFAGMAAFPEWAPPGETHLLGTSTVVVDVAYSSHDVRWRTSRTPSTENLRVAGSVRAVQIGNRMVACGQPGTDACTSRKLLNGGGTALEVTHASADSVSVEFGVPRGCATAPIHVFAGVALGLWAIRSRRRRDRP